jgi:hypothetical protein
MWQTIIMIIAAIGLLMLIKDLLNAGKPESAGLIDKDSNLF